MTRWTNPLARHGVGIQLAGRTDGRARRCNHGSSRRRPHRGTRRLGVVRATRRDAEQGVCIRRSPRLASLLHETGRPSAHIGSDVRFGKRIVNIKRSLVGVVGARNKDGKPRLLASSCRNEQAQCPREDRPGNACSRSKRDAHTSKEILAQVVEDNESDASGVHVSRSFLTAGTSQGGSRTHRGHPLPPGLLHPA